MTETNLPDLSVADVDPSLAKLAGEGVTPDQRIQTGRVVIDNGIPLDEKSGKPLDPAETDAWRFRNERLRTNLEAVGPGNTIQTP